MENIYIFAERINSSEEGNMGAIIYVVAIVETKNGEILELPSNTIKFVDTEVFFQH